MPDGSRPPGPEDRPERPEEADERHDGPSGMVILLIAAALIIGGYFLSMKLAEMSRIQDCVMSGRTNCAPIEAPPNR